MAGRGRPSAGAAPAPAADPLAGAIDRHNARLGTRLQRAVQVLLWNFMLGPALHPLLRLLFRVHVSGGGRLAVLRGPAMFPTQHFHEWDSLAVWLASTWPYALTRWHLVPHAFVGRLWMRTPLLRGMSWALGFPGLVRGVGADKQSAFAQVRRWLAGRTQPPGLVICPTGAIGRSREYTVHAGVAHLAACSREMRVHPVALAGFAELEWRDVLRLRRPRLVIAIGEPFRVADIGAEGEQFVAEVCARVRTGWENALREAGQCAPGRSGEAQ